MPRLSCGCSFGDHDTSLVFEWCAVHDPAPKPAPKCAAGCDRPDSETCKRATWEYQCGCCCHPEIRQMDVHQVIEDRLIKRDGEELTWRENNR